MKPLVPWIARARMLFAKRWEALKGQLTILAISHNRAMVQAADYVYRMTDGTASLLPKEDQSVLAK